MYCGNAFDHVTWTTWFPFAFSYSLPRFFLPEEQKIHFFCFLFPPAARVCGPEKFPQNEDAQKKYISKPQMSLFPSLSWTNGPSHNLLFRFFFSFFSEMLCNGMWAEEKGRVWNNYGRQGKFLRERWKEIRQKKIIDLYRFFLLWWFWNVMSFSSSHTCEMYECKNYRSVIDFSFPRSNIFQHYCHDIFGIWVRQIWLKCQIQILAHAGWSFPSG